MTCTEIFSVQHETYQLICEVMQNLSYSYRTTHACITALSAIVTVREAFNSFLKEGNSLGDLGIL